MVDGEYPEIVTLQDGPFSGLHRAGVPPSNGKRTKPSRSSLDSQTVKVWFFHKLLLVTNCESGVGLEKEEKWRKVTSLYKNRTSRRPPQVAEDLSTTGTPISAHQCMITPKAASIEGISSSAGELEEYEDLQRYTKLEDCDSVEVEMRNGEMGVKYVKERWVGPKL